MTPTTEQPPRPPEEIDHRAIKLLVGLIAILLGNVTNLVSSSHQLESISQSYHEGGWSRDIFIGFLFAIAAFMFTYNGKEFHEKVMSKVAAVAALGVALFPCECRNYPVRVPFVHGISAAVMFLVLAGFCYLFHRRALEKRRKEAKRRAGIYAACGIVMMGAILALTINNFVGDIIYNKCNRIVFYGELAGLIAFGVSWLTASKVFPFLTNQDERFSPFGANPADG